MVTFIPVKEEFDQVREIKEIFPREKFQRKCLKDIEIQGNIRIFMSIAKYF